MKPDKTTAALRREARKEAEDWWQSPSLPTPEQDYEDLAKRFIRFARKARAKALKEAAALLNAKVRHDHTNGECPYCEMPKHYAKQIIALLTKRTGKKK